MLQIGNLSNALQKRLIRPLYAHTQATPYAATLDASLRNTDGSFRLPLAADVAAATPTNAAGPAPLTRSADAFSLQGGLVPGLVMVKTKNAEALAVAAGADVASAPFGLLANFVGGVMDDLKTNNEIGCWRGPDSTWELLWPSFDATGLSSAYGTSTAGVPVGLYATAKGQLGATAALVGAAVGAKTKVADLIEYTPAKIIIDLKV